VAPRDVRGPGVDASSIWSGASERTRALVVSHVTSPTALVLPVGELCGLARGAGVPAALEFVADCSGLPAFAAEQPLQMACFCLPGSDPERVELRLLEEFRIEAPVRNWNGQTPIRVSIAPYNGADDVEALVVALQELFRPLCM
jgi:selenocysteine lyase/cysteine desulfurase